MFWCGSHWRYAFFLLVLLGFLDRAFGQDAMALDRQATFLLRALSFDRNLKQRSPEGLYIGVLYQGEQKEAAGLVARAFEQAGQDWEASLAVKATVVPFESVEKLLKWIDDNRINTLYIHPSAETGLSSIQQVTRGRKVPSIGATRKQVEQGASLGVYLVNGTPKVVINLRASRVEGLRFGAGLLNIATVIK